MKHEIIAKPSYSAVKFTLNTGETLQAESGAMLAVDESATLTGTMKGGLLKSLGRSLFTRESFFITTIDATAPNTEVYLAPRATGDVEMIELNHNDYIVQGGSFLASTTGIETSTKWSGMKGFFSGEGLFMIKASGTGQMFVSSFGGILTKELKPGEKFIVDNGHIVAFPASMNYNITKMGDGMVNMVTTGEGLVSVFEGPGTIYLQTRNLRTFAEELNPFMASRRSSQGGNNLLGQVFGG